MTTPDDQFEISAHPQNASLARDRVRAVAAQADFSHAALGDLEIAVGEAVTNAILYGSPSATSRIIISCAYRPDVGVFEVEVRDQGQGFDPDQIREDNNADMLGGRGLRLMRALMDTVTLEYTGAGMTVLLSKSHHA